MTASRIAYERVATTGTPAALAFDMGNPETLVRDRRKAAPQSADETEPAIAHPQLPTATLPLCLSRPAEGRVGKVIVQPLVSNRRRLGRSIYLLERQRPTGLDLAEPLIAIMHRSDNLVPTEAVERLLSGCPS